MKKSVRNSGGVTIALWALVFAVVLHLMFGNRRSSDEKPAAQTVNQPVLPIGRAYNLNINDMARDVVIGPDDRAGANSDDALMTVTFRYNLVASSDMWIRDTASLSAGLMTGFHVVLYGPDGPLPNPEGVQLIVETSGTTVSQGTLLPAGTPVFFSLTVRQPFQAGFVGVRLQSARVFLNEPDLPEGLEIPFADSDPVFDTGLMDCREDGTVPSTAGEQERRA